MRNNENLYRNRAIHIGLNFYTRYTGYGDSPYSWNKNCNQWDNILIEGINIVTFYGRNQKDIKTCMTYHHFIVCNYGYFLYVYQYEEMRFICSITRQKEFDNIHANLKHLHPMGEMKCKAIVKYPFSEKNMIFLMKQTMTLLGNNKFEGSFENVKLIVDIVVAL